MRTIICGGRDYEFTEADKAFLDKMLTELPITEVLEGGSTGADFEARIWSSERGVPYATYDAEWDNITAPGAVVRYRAHDGKPYNALAGPWRNEKMATLAQVCIVFPGNRGTADMVKRAHRHGLRVIASEEFTVKYGA